MKTLLLMLSFCLSFTVCFAQFGEANPIELGGVYPSTGEIADLNGDGKLDVIIASESKNRIYWFENYGNRQFSTERLLSNELTEPKGLKAADLDMDGDMDILCGSWNVNTIYWFENDGAGNFAAPQIISDDVRTPQSIEVSDIDADGDLDVLSTAYWDGTVAWHENDGFQNFPNQHIVSAEVDMAYLVRVADFDQDGLIDVFAGSYSGGKVAWFKNEGQGTFSEPILIMEGLLSLQDVIIEDVDEDGDIDLLIASLFQHELFFFQNDGNGNFGTPTIIDDIPYNVSQLQFEDMNQDGYKDIIASDSQIGTIIIKPNDGTAHFPKYSYYSLNDVMQDTNILLTADFTQTGVIDFLVGSPQNRFVALYENHYNNGFKFLRSILTSGIFGPKDMVVGDVDGDGDKDLVIASDFDHQVTWIENTNAGGRFDKHHVLLSDFRGANSLALEDFDKDGDLDLAIGGFGEPEVVLYNNDGQGNFTFKQVVVEAEGVVAVKAGDVNGDGDLDLLVASSVDRIIRWKHNNGSGVFGIVPTVVTDIAYQVVSVALADVDNDNYLDVITSNDGWNDILFYRNAGGVYEDRVRIDGNFQSSYSVKAGDIDGDGFADVIASSTAKDAVYWYKGNGLGGFEDQELIGGNLNNPRELAVKDFDQDGDLDVMVAVREENKVVWFPNYGTGVFGERQVVLNNAPKVEYIVAEDLDNDDYPEVFSFSQYRTNMRWQENLFFNSIRGLVFWDTNENGIKDEGELSLIDQVVTISSTEDEHKTYTGIEGQFTYYSKLGAYEVSMESNSLWELTTEESFQIEVTGTSHLEPIYFGLKPARILHRVEPHLTASITRCNRAATYWLHYKNTGTTIANGTITLETDELMGFISSNPEPNSIEGNTLTWNFSELHPSYENKISLQFQMPDFNSMGEILETQATIQLFNENQELTYTKTTDYNSELLCSYDPNDKLTRSNLLGQSEFAYIADTILYTVRFQNTGNDTAFNIRIEDVLDKKLDWTTFHPITASHDYRTELNRETGLATFYFNDILLPDSTTNEIESHGFVTFGIASLEGIEDKTEVENTASIFFDFNPPIITNTAVLTLLQQVETDIEVLENGASIRVFPNPFSDFTTIEVEGLPQGNYRLELMDILGRKVRELKSIGNGEWRIERGKLESGVYFWRILEEGNQAVLGSGKVLVE
ncbi:MAG: FG-GAP-like repeat-containing protein [Chitinophagales bacterium]